MKIVGAEAVSAATSSLKKRSSSELNGDEGRSARSNAHHASPVFNISLNIGSSATVGPINIMGPPSSSSVQGFLANPSDGGISGDHDEDGGVVA